MCDTSEYSWFTPYATAWITMAPAEVGWHNWLVTACAGSSIGRKAMNVAAKVIAAAATDGIADPRVVKAAKRELQERLSGRSLVKLIPDSVQTPTNINKAVMINIASLLIKGGFTCWIFDGMDGAAKALLPPPVCLDK